MAGNLIVNGGFEAGQAPWQFYADSGGAWTLASPAYECLTAARIDITGSSGNIQLYQTNLLLTANTTYRLRFAAYSSTGHDLGVYIHKHNEPFANYGLHQDRIDLGTGWQQYTLEFTTSGFSGTVNDARLRFWLAPFAQSGDMYWIDDVQLTQVTGGGDTPTPTPTMPSATPVPTPTDTLCTPLAENLVQNGSFENGLTPWVFYTNGSGHVALKSPAYDCLNAAQIQIDSVGNNVQLYQPNLTLEAGVRYRLHFAAYSSTGHDLGVYLHNHRSPYENYGLAVAQLDLGSGWQEYNLEFTANGFSGTAINGRLRFWLAPFAQAGDLYWIDAVTLTRLAGDVATPTPTPTVTNTPVGPTATPTMTPTAVPCAPVANNLLGNGNFEGGTTGWQFYDPKVGSFTTNTPAYDCQSAASVQINQFGDNIQLYQRGITLEANTQYRLQFAAYSNTGADLAIYLHNHTSPYENYGLAVDQVNLGTGWQFYTIDFTTRGFSGTVNNARLRFWLAPFTQAGDLYWIDAVSLVKVSDLVTAQELSDETPIVVTNSGFLVGLTEAEFDPILLGLIANGNDVGEVQLENRIFLPFVNR